jgi:hypothetical protein
LRMLIFLNMFSSAHKSKICWVSFYRKRKSSGWGRWLALKRFCFIRGWAVSIPRTFSQRNLHVRTLPISRIITLTAMNWEKMKPFSPNGSKRNYAIWKKCQQNKSASRGLEANKIHFTPRRKPSDSTTKETKLSNLTKRLFTSLIQLFQSTQDS